MTTPVPAPPAFDYVGGDANLDALLAMEDFAKLEADAAKERHEELKARIKVALTAVTYQPGGVEAAQPYRRYNIRVPGQAPRLLSWVTSRRVVTASLKSRYPEVYEECSNVTGTWKLERAK